MNLNYIALSNFEVTIKNTIKNLEEDLNRRFPTKEYISKLPTESQEYLLSTRNEMQQAIDQLREFHTEIAAEQWAYLKKKR